jgi:haloacetate dehalogenase
MWHRVAPALAARAHRRGADLRGYGDSSAARPADHSNYCKRVMAADMVALMRSLGHERFDLVGHDCAAAYPIGWRATTASACDRRCARHLPDPGDV